MKISFVIPCYGSEHTIEQVVDEIRQTVATRPSFDYEIVLVSDCPPDNTFKVIRTLAEQDAHITAVELAKNSGQPNAILAGLHVADGDYVCCGDDDGQTVFCETFRLLDELGDDCDIVFGRYEERGRKSWFRDFGSNVNEWMLHTFLDKKKEWYMSSFFVMKKFVAQKMTEYPNPYPFIEGLVLRVTHRIKNVDVVERERFSGKSGYSFIKLISLWINGFTAFSVKPLRIASFCGFLIAALGLGYGVFVVIRRLMEMPEEVSEGWASLAVLIAVVGGLILMVLGLLGEYIGRLYISINKSPQFVVRSIVKKEDPDVDKKAK